MSRFQSDLLACKYKFTIQSYDNLQIAYCIISMKLNCFVEDVPLVQITAHTNIKTKNRSHNCQR